MINSLLEIYDGLILYQPNTVFILLVIFFICIVFGIGFGLFHGINLVLFVLNQIKIKKRKRKSIIILFVTGYIFLNKTYALVEKEMRKKKKAIAKIVKAIQTELFIEE